MRLRTLPGRHVRPVLLAGTALLSVSVALGQPTTRPGLDLSTIQSGDTQTAVADVPTTLGELFSSEAAGISVQPPAGGKMSRGGGAIGSDEVVRWVNDDQQWTFVVSRFILADPIEIHIESNGPNNLRGFADLAAAQMPNDTPGKLVNMTFVPIDTHDGAMLAAAFTLQGGKPRLQQQAIIRRNGRVFYVLTFTTARQAGADVMADPLVKKAAATFKSVVDKTQMVDQEHMVQDQNDRLIRTRATLVNWTQERMQKALVPEQWTRTLQDGKDVGYSYTIEEIADDLPRGKYKPAAGGGNGSGIRVGTRSRFMQPDGDMSDTESWSWIANDRKQEAFSNLAVITPHTGTKTFGVERGSMTRTNKPLIEKRPDPVDPRRTIDVVVDSRDAYTLQVWSVMKQQGEPPLQLPLPPYYLPQALCHLLPRLLPLNETRTYMFANYDTSQRGILTRYVDVLPISQVDLNGEKVLAVSIRERLGYEGIPTTHYYTKDGRWLGTVNEQTHVTELPTDAETLKKIWKDVDLSRPADVQENAQAPGDGGLNLQPTR